MLRPGYSLPKSYHISAMMAPLAQLLHCVEESVACPMGPLASGDSRTDAEAGLAVGTKQRVQQFTRRSERDHVQQFSFQGFPPVPRAPKRNPTVYCPISNIHSTLL